MSAVLGIPLIAILSGYNAESTLFGIILIYAFSIFGILRAHGVIQSVCGVSFAALAVAVSMFSESAGMTAMFFISAVGAGTVIKNGNGYGMKLCVFIAAVTALIGLGVSGKGGIAESTNEEMNMCVALIASGIGLCEDYKKIPISVTAGAIFAVIIYFVTGIFADILLALSSVGVGAGIIGRITEKGVLYGKRGKERKNVEKTVLR